MDKYKSWSGLNKKLRDNLCNELKDQITYFLTRYHDAHNSYGRGAIRLNGKEIVLFSWIEMYHQEVDMSGLYSSLGIKMNKGLSYEKAREKLKSKWDENCTYYEMDFLDAALQFCNLSIQDALVSENYIIKALAIMDRRIGKRTLLQISKAKEYTNYPDWVRQFYDLRLTETL